MPDPECPDCTRPSNCDCPGDKKEEMECVIEGGKYVYLPMLILAYTSQIWRNCECNGNKAEEMPGVIE